MQSQARHVSMSENLFALSSYDCCCCFFEADVGMLLEDKKEQQELNDNDINITPAHQNQIQIMHIYCFGVAPFKFIIIFIKA